MSKLCDGKNCEWKELYDELAMDYNELLEDVQRDNARTRAELADAQLQHGDPTAALALLAEGDPHDYLNIMEDE